MAITASRPQIKYLTSLVENRQVPAWVAQFLREVQEGYPTKEASRAIDAAAQAMPKPRVQSLFPEAPKVKEAVPVGFYFLDGEVYKVKHSQGDTTRRYAYIFKTDGTTKGRYEYTKGAIYRLTLADKLTLAQAAAIGHRTGVCCCCGKELSDSKSVALGIGPVCIKKYM